MDPDNSSPLPPTDWECLIDAEHWSLYKCVLHRAKAQRLPFALGGGLALSVYTGALRSTKDIDLYVMPEDRERAIGIVNACGLVDYFEVKDYDRGWIYRAHQNGVIVDTIWSMANQRSSVDAGWIEDGRSIQLFGEELRVIPPEELIWSKLYVMQRDRCDWPDILNLIDQLGPELDWDHLLDRVSEDLPLIQSVLSVYCWVHPEGAMNLPRWLWESLGMPFPKCSSDPDGRPLRHDLLDTRPWFFKRGAAA